MALITTGSPARVVRPGPPIYVRGQTYYSITQDMADWFAWGQNDDGSGTARGGWCHRPGISPACSHPAISLANFFPIPGSSRSPASPRASYISATLSGHSSTAHAALR